MRPALATAFALLSLLTTGCASIVGGQNQSVSISTDAQGMQVSGASCSLENDKGTWFAETPGSVTVRRSYNPLKVTCKHQDYVDGQSSVPSSTKGLAFGNILVGGVIGAGVDIATGAAYDYPPLITVALSKTATIPSGEPATAAASAALPLVAKVATSTAPEAGLAKPTRPLANARADMAPRRGQEAFQVEAFARQSACHTSPVAQMTDSGPGFEAYRVDCEKGDALVLRCEFGSCQPTR